VASVNSGLLVRVILVRDRNGRRIRPSLRQLRPGDLVFFPAGSSCTWRVTVCIRKSAVLRETMWPALGLALKVTKKLLRMNLPVHGSLGDIYNGDKSRMPADAGPRLSVPG
jgi:EutQ-like cupin domain